MYVYIESESGLWTVGFYQPNGKWKAESDHEVEEEAAQRVAWLNGSWGANAGLLSACKAWVAYFDRLSRDDEPGDKLVAARNAYHRDRVEATRAAIEKAEAK